MQLIRVVKATCSYYLILLSCIIIRSVCVMLYHFQKNFVTSSDLCMATTNTTSATSSATATIRTTTEHYITMTTSPTGYDDNVDGGIYQGISQKKETEVHEY